MKKELAELEAEVGWEAMHAGCSQRLRHAHRGYFNDESLLLLHGGHGGRLWRCLLGGVAIVVV